MVHRRKIAAHMPSLARSLGRVAAIVLAVFVAALGVVWLLPPDQDGYSIATERDEAFERKVQRVAVVVDVDERLMPVFARAFEHGMAEAFESNGVDASVHIAAIRPDRPLEDPDDVRAPAHDARMRVEIDPLYRARDDGYQAVVGTVFEAALTDVATGNDVWHASGKVDYIRMFGPSFVASDNMRKEFGWKTVAAIVDAFIADVNGADPAPIYTSIEGRRNHGQRVD